MKTTAAVLVETGKPLELAELELPSLGTGQVLVEVLSSGVCHTQVLECRGYRGPDRFLPHCLGHEGSGIVREVGAGVTKVRPGDFVVLSWIKGAGADVAGWSYDWSGRKVNAGPVTTFSQHTIASENRLTKLPTGFSADYAALVGCAVPTGFGAVFNTAQPSPGQTLVVFGAGGIGLCAVAAASLAGCVTVVAVDVNPDKLAVARQMGATHCVQAGQDDTLAEIARICPGGADFAIEATGRPAVMADALAVVRPRGGAAVVVGNAREGERLEIDPKQFNQGKQLRGTWGGDSIPDRDYPRYFQLLAAGRANLDPLLSRTYSLEEVNEAIDDLEAGRAVRPLIRIGSA